MILCTMNLADSKVLVIDKKIIFRSLLVNVLEQVFQVDYCDNCLAGLQLLSEGNIPDLIILEYESPKLNGLQFLKEIRNSGFFKDLPVIVQTVSDKESIKDLCQHLSVDHIVSKPYDIQRLKSQVIQIIQKKKSREYAKLISKLSM